MDRADNVSMIDLHKVYFDDESYNSGHGKAYEFYGIEPSRGAVAIVRPDHCRYSPFLFSPDYVGAWKDTALMEIDISMITKIENHEAIGDFFRGFALRAS